jgi:hypothetical protein
MDRFSCEVVVLLLLYRYLHYIGKLHGIRICSDMHCIGIHRVADDTGFGDSKIGS